MTTTNKSANSMTAHSTNSMANTMPGEVWILCTELMISSNSSYIIMINETTNNTENNSPF